ncbi:DUF599 domain-containing protein [Marimonas sp. MJW-29]|uniref:DUF599 domain-containing protein n=1 Tax=Sulfitobacter sediminis TaxID=3234186 RepID=A0ABV3RGS9_9RHOB
MNFRLSLDLFAPLDFAAIALLFGCWLLIGWRIESARFSALSVSRIMADYRREWMQQMVTREPRIFDAQTIATLRQGTSFFASTSMIALGATLALIGNTETFVDVAEDITLVTDPPVVWEIKLLVIVFFLTNAFLKFAWSNRLFGYCSVIMAAVPNDPADQKAPLMARKAAEVNVTAARSFNRGLRAIYFALASVAWLGGPLLLIAAAILTLVVIWRREFASQSRSILLEK